MIGNKGENQNGEYNDDFPHTKPTVDQETLSPEKYDEIFMGKKKRRKALERAWTTRNFEIELIWKRGTYFWAFTASAFAAYFAIVGSEKILTSSPQLEYIIICIGLILSLSWTLVNKGSRNWQRNWEGHIDRLEELVTGPLYRTIKDFPQNHSVTKINIYISQFISYIWVILGINYFFKSKNTCFSSAFQIHFIEVITTTTLIIFACIIYFRGKSGDKKSDEGISYKIRKIN